jgi:prepilin-type N-terminal cleavage/methylation domain-containing protein
MESRSPLRPQSGFTLVETLLVLALLAMCFAIGGLALVRGLAAVQARGAAASWQAAATWAQIGASGKARREVATAMVCRWHNAPRLATLVLLFPVSRSSRMSSDGGGAGVVVRFVGGSGALTRPVLCISGHRPGLPRHRAHGERADRQIRLSQP